MNSKKQPNRKDVKRVSRSQTYKRLRIRTEEERQKLDEAHRKINTVTAERDEALKALAKLKEAQA